MAMASSVGGQAGPAAEDDDSHDGMRPVSVHRRLQTLYKLYVLLTTLVRTYCVNGAHDAALPVKWEKCIRKKGHQANNTIFQSTTL